MQVSEKNILFVGGGTMAEAIVKGMLTTHITPPGRITVSDADANRLSWIHEEYRINTAKPDTINVGDAHAIILSVKPDMLPEVLETLSPDISPAQTVISIAMGVPIRDIESRLKDKVAVVRVMPNTPAIVQRGMIAIARGTAATEADVLFTRAIFSTIGLVIDIDEKLMDVFTAVSGSGPAYVFYFMEGMIAAAANHGMSKTQALSIVAETIRGAGEMIARTHEQPHQLREHVTLPDGPTKAAIDVFENNDLKSVVMHAIDAAIQRCNELT
jgi:pyrroline-5-carboxylate reductase